MEFNTEFGNEFNMEFRSFRPLHNPKNYPNQLYNSELKCHEKGISEYYEEVCDFQEDQIESLKPNLDLIKQQPAMTLSFRLKLVDFLLRTAHKLKVSPFAFFEAVKLFDRYSSKRVVLKEQTQLAICTCLWITCKMNGGCNHCIYSSANPIGGRFKGPSQRARIPKLKEFVILCGKSCNYDESMFVQMEKHILETMDWQLSGPQITDFLVESRELNNSLPSQCMEIEIFKMKEYLANVALYSEDLIEVDIRKLSLVIKELINETLGLTPFDLNYQSSSTNKVVSPYFEDYPSPISLTSSAASAVSSEVSSLNSSMFDFCFSDKEKIRNSLLNAAATCSESLLSLFNSAGPREIYNQARLMTSYEEQPSLFVMGPPPIHMDGVHSNTPRVIASPKISPIIEHFPSQRGRQLKNGEDPSNIFDYLTKWSSRYPSQASQFSRYRYPSPAPERAD